MKNMLIWKDRKRIMGMPISFTRYRLYGDRLVSDIGLLSRTEDEILLYRVTDVKTRVTIINRMFGVGSVTLYSADTSSPVLEITRVKNPRNVKDKISELVENERNRLGIPGREMFGFAGNNVQFR